jgi:hypothetical protein
MKKFAGIELENFSYDSCSNRRLRNIQNAFVSNYLQHIRTLNEQDKHDQAAMLKQIINSDNFQKTSGHSVVKHLINYIKFGFIPTLSDDQDMALAIRFLPDRTCSPFLGKDDLLIEMVKQTIGDYKYNLRDIKLMLAKIDDKREALDFMHNWGDSVARISYAVHTQNLVIAYEILGRIIELSNDTKIKQEDLPYVLSLQIVYYVDIMKFIMENLGRNPLIDVYSSVEHELKKTIKKLKSLPEVAVETAPAKDNVLCSMFFSSLHRFTTKPRTGTDDKARRSGRVHPL